MLSPLLCLLLKLGQLLLNGSDGLPKSRLLPHTAVPQCDGQLAEVCRRLKVPLGLACEHGTVSL